LASLAARAAMSPRPLQRQFGDATGVGPYEWLFREVVGVAKVMFERDPALPVARVAALAGFGSEESLRRHIRRIAATSPAAYRRRFDAG
ncbi:helix-turn-helix domain-containing protein, partial [Burkholderia pseudomallei]